MSDYLTNEERAQIATDAKNVFDTMTKDAVITVHKEPIKTLIEPSPSNLFGYGDEAGDDAYTYTPVTGQFPALIMFANTVNKSPLVPEINARIAAWPITLKVERDCRDFIVSGKTEKIEADGLTFLLDGSEQYQMVLCPDYFLFPLKQTS